MGSAASSSSGPSGSALGNTGTSTTMTPTGSKTRLVATSYGQTMAGDGLMDSGASANMISQNQLMQRTACVQMQQTMGAAGMLTPSKWPGSMLRRRRNSSNSKPRVS